MTPKLLFACRCVQSPPTIADIRIIGIGTSASIRYSAPGAIKRSGDLDEYRRVSAKTFLYIGAALAGKLDELPPLKGK